MRRTAGSVLALGLVLAPLGAGAPASAVASADEDRSPSWLTELPATLNSPDLPLRDGAVVDPASGDVLTHFVDTSYLTARTRVRRTDGGTGETVWEVGLGGIASAPTAMALDAEAGRVAVVSGSKVYSVGLDGQVGWSARTRVPGDPVDLVVNPVTGTTCLASADWNGSVGSRARGTWYLACLDRDGRPAGTSRFHHRGLSDGPAVLAVNPELSTWYVAGTHRVGRGSRTVLLAHREGGKRLWKASRDHGHRDASVDSIAVDLANNLVHVGGGNGVRATLLSWTAGGRPMGNRVWRSGRTVDDLAVDVPRRRLVASVAKRRGGTEVRVLRPRGRTLRRFTHPGRGIGAARVALDPERRRVFVAGPRAAAYRWNGTRLWRGTERRLRTVALVVDPARDRVVLLSTSFASQMPQTQLSAYPR